MHTMCPLYQLDHFNGCTRWLRDHMEVGTFLHSVNKFLSGWSAILSLEAADLAACTLEGHFSLIYSTKSVALYCNGSNLSPHADTHSPANVHHKTGSKMQCIWGRVKDSQNACMSNHLGTPHSCFYFLRAEGLRLSVCKPVDYSCSDTTELSAPECGEKVTINTFTPKRIKSHPQIAVWCGVKHTSHNQ